MRSALWMRCRAVESIGASVGSAAVFAWLTANAVQWKISPEFCVGMPAEIVLFDAAYEPIMAWTLPQVYAKAWRGHDVEELRRIGQVTSEVQAAALRDYFARVEDLDVEVQLLEVRPRGDHRTVRFTRRDRFRDPLGRLVTQETAVQKDIARTANGLRFVLSGP